MTDQELVDRAIKMQEFSYVPYSRFPVGAALLCDDGTVFTGCNVENAAFGSTICAERTALLKAVSEGRRTGWMTLAIAGRGSDFCWPCGACRQMLYEFCGTDMPVIMAKNEDELKVMTLGELLPEGFGPANLLG